MHHVAEARVALGRAFSCGLLPRSGVPFGLPTILLFGLAAVVLGPHVPRFDPVDDTTAELPRWRLAGTRGQGSLGREGTCRSPT